MAFPQWVLDLQTRRDAITAELAAIDNNGSRTKPGAKPDVSGDGGGVEGDSYRRGLMDELTSINEILMKAGDVVAAEEAADGNVFFEIVTELN